MKFLSNSSFKTVDSNATAPTLEFPVIKSFDSAAPDTQPVVGQLYFRQGASNSELRVYTGVSTQTWKTINTTNIASDVTWGAKGQLIVATGNDAAATLAVGSDNTVLIADSGAGGGSVGVKWSTIGLSSLSATGTASSSTYLRGDNTWASPTTLANDVLWAAKGDLAVATANDAASVLSVGASNTVLIPDATTATGLKWAQLPVTSISATGTPSASTFLRGDGSWVTPATVATDVIWNAKGDLAVGTGADTASVLTVGANNTVLIADSGAGGGTVGVKWANITVSSISATGTPSSTTFLRGDGAWATPAGGGTAADDQNNILANQVFS